MPNYGRKEKVIRGVATIYYQLIVPGGTPAALPDDSLPYSPPNSADAVLWPAPWIPMGFSAQGASITFERETQEERVEESETALDEWTESINWALAVTLAEDTLENVRLSAGGGTISVKAASQGIPGTRSFRYSNSIDTIAIGLEGRAPRVTGVDKPWRRILVPEAKATGEVETNYRRSEDRREYPSTFAARCATEDIEYRDVNAAPLV